MVSNETRDWLDIIPKLPGWLQRLIALVTAVVAFITLLQVNPVLVIIVLLVVGWAGCFYLAFKRTPPQIEGGLGFWKYPRLRPWALRGLIIIPLSAGGWWGFNLYEQSQPSGNIIILVAKFDGEKPEKYRLTETVWQNLIEAFQKYDDVQVWPVEPVFKKHSDITEGEKQNATIVIWGWYGTTKEATLSVHFDVLRQPENFPELGLEAKGQLRTITLEELESATLRNQLSAEMAYLSLFTVGMARYEAQDWGGAIDSYSSALKQIEEQEPMSTLGQSVVYDSRGKAYADKGDYDQAIDNYNQAIELDPDFAEAIVGRAGIHEYKGDDDQATKDYIQAGDIYYDKYEYDKASTSYGRAIHLRPDTAEFYYKRGVAYHHMDCFDNAFDDLNKVFYFDLSKDIDLRDLAEKELERLEKEDSDRLDARSYPKEECSI